jgi:signal transduction histidine kinase/PAS domain-containing protein
MQVAPYVILYLFPAIISAGLAVYGWRRRQYRAAEQFSLLMAALAFWSACHALSVADPTLEGTLFWAKVQYGGVVLVGPFWFLFALAYADQWRRVTLRLWAFLLIVATTTYALVLTNDLHMLWWTSVAIDTARPFVSLMVERGLPFWLHTIYSYSCILFGLGLFFHTMIASPPVYQHQAFLMVIGALIPIVGNIAHLMGFSTVIVDDPTPFLLLGSGLVIFYALMRYQLLDLAPIAEHEIFAGIPDGIVVLDRTGLVSSINDPAPSLLAVSPKRWLGMHFLDLVTESPLAPALRDMLASAPSTASRRVTYVGTDGSRGVEIRLRPLLTDNGGLAGTLLVLRDTTERVRMLEALDQRFAELTLINQIARAANAAAQTDDLIHVMTHEIVQAKIWDRVIIGLLQSDSETLQIVFDHPSEHDAALTERHEATAEFAPVPEILRAGHTGAIEGTVAGLAGVKIDRILRELGVQTFLAVPLFSQSRLIGVLFLGNSSPQATTAEMIRLAEMIGELITEAIIRTQLYEEAQQASKLKSVFMATVSHELRTPLTAVMGYADMVRHGAYGALPDALQDPIRYICYGGQTLQRLINDILEFSRMESGRFNIDLFPVEPLAVIQNVIGALRPQIEERGLRLQLDLGNDLPMIYANSTRLEQVLNNLISNAIKFTDAGYITLQVQNRGDWLRISVQDTGIGIAKEDQELIFGEFRQGTSSHARHRGGAGLGLAISRRLVEVMGGKLSLESTPNVGSMFHLDLQIAAVQAAEHITMA